MKNFRNKMMSLLDMTSIQVNEAVNDIFDAINTIDWEKHLAEMNERKDALMEKANALLAEAKEFLDDSKNCLCDFEITVPFNKAKGETIEYEVDENNILRIAVSLETDDENYTYKKKVTIPSGCDTSNIKMEVDEANNVAKFTIPRASGDGATTEVIDENGDENDGTQSVKDVLSRKLKDTMKKSQERLARDSRGRFTRMEPNADAAAPQNED